MPAKLHRFERRDPADRLLIMTAIELAGPPVAYDDRIARFGKKHGTQYGFVAGAAYCISDVTRGAGAKRADLLASVSVSPPTSVAKFIKLPKSGMRDRFSWRRSRRRR